MGTNLGQRVLGGAHHAFDFPFSFFLYLLQLLVQAGAFHVLTVTRKLSRVVRIEFLGYSPFSSPIPCGKELEKLLVYEHLLACE